MKGSESEYKVLNTFEKNPNMTQRDVAKTLGISLGKTHYVITSLVNKGWLKLENFKRSKNKKGYVYLLTLSGMTEKTRMTWYFLKRKEVEYNKLKIEIEQLKHEIASKSTRENN